MVDLLAASSIPFVVRNYVAEPLDQTELAKLVVLVGGDPNDLVRDDEIRSACLVMDHLMDHPASMQRPIASNGHRAIIARPAGLVFTIAEDGRDTQTSTGAHLGELATATNGSGSV